MRFSGAVGYATTEETSSGSGVFVESMTERTYFGDVTRNARRLEAPSQVPPVVNPHLVLENSFSILADAEAYANFKSFRYIRWENNVWTITNVEVRRPRLILTVGGQWDGDTA